MNQAPHLKPGDAIGIAAPSSVFDVHAFEKGLDILKRWQLKPIFDRSIFEQHRYFAGSQLRRLSELQEMLDQSDLKAILFARGGFGSHYILPRLDFAGLKSHPKRIIGFSDLTMLLERVRSEAKLVSYYGPSVCYLGQSRASSFMEAFKKTLFAAGSQSHPLGSVEVVKPGLAEGRLIGGCLTLISMSVGTSFEFKTSGGLLLIEDINEEVYQIERMLLHLRQSGKLRGVQGIVISELKDPKRKVRKKEWVEMIREVLADFKGPIIYGAHFGHVKNPHIFPIGSKALLDTKKKMLVLL